MVLRVLFAGGRGSGASAGAYPAWQPITCEFESALIECEFFGSVLSHHALNQFPSSARASILLLHRPGVP